jgi:hypothetical protein
MYILRQLPFRDAASFVEVAGEPIAIRPYQIIVWVSLSVSEVLDADAPRFPAVLDTGHNHNFSIRERQLLRWAGIGADMLPQLGEILVNQREVPLLAVSLWIHQNRAGSNELLPRSYRLDLPQGIAVYADETIGAPRLPLLGLRGLVTNELYLTIDGTHRWVSLRTSSNSRASQSPRRR